MDDAPPLTVMGLMSGTSVDAVDACLARLQFAGGQLSYRLLGTYSLPVPAALRQRLLQVMADKTVHLEVLCALNVAVGELFAQTALGLMADCGLSAADIDGISSHGQTVYHWPPVAGSGQLGGTLQIGEPSIIAEQTGVPTVADFRPRDMAAGGQGAPLVCLADQWLFQHERLGRCVQNIGGIANVTVLSARQAVDALPVVAFDTGPGNMLLDAAALRFFERPYDEDGGLARQGQVRLDVLHDLMAHPYLQQRPPKTTGREAFGLPFLESLVQRYPAVSGADWLATLTRFTVDSIVGAYQQFVWPTYTVHEVIVGGGGVRNEHLMETLAHRLREARPDSPMTVRTHAEFNIPDQYKEALAFAILGYAALVGRTNNLPACTGAAHPVIMGKLVR